MPNPTPEITMPEQPDTRPELTERQSEVLKYIKVHRDLNGYSPTTREIGDYFGYVQTAAMNHVRALEKKGYVTTKRGASRTIVPV